MIKKAAQISLMKKTLIITLIIGACILLISKVAFGATFGNTNNGTSTGSIACATAGNILLGKYTGSAGTGNSMSIYGDARGSGGKHIQAYLYDAGGLQVTNGITDIGNAPTTTAAWTTLNFTTSPTLTAQNYWVALWTDVPCPITANGFEVLYDAGQGVGKTSAGGTAVYNTWPASVTTSSPNTNNYSMYVTYDVPATSTYSHPKITAGKMKIGQGGGKLIIR